MQNLWEVFDIENKGFVNITELRTFLRALNIDPDEDELESITKQIDPNGRGCFDFPMLTMIIDEKLKDVDTVEELLE